MAFDVCLCDAFA
ncbi:hypothetical protein V4V60_003766 [Vibrio mimicus]|nr:hypothetical protein [Vibrio cholerae]EGQ9207092.1 hypothetical protein [Vibrio cholerae]EGQ9332780.1 hypothetical protein [Vibrio cholerae]EGR0261286.1 hypothetical protein [Vibrio cholerae]EGR0487729.1 hypothetical protein [Vibrio cholerae]